MAVIWPLEILIFYAPNSMQSFLTFAYHKFVQIMKYMQKYVKENSFMTY